MCWTGSNVDPSEQYALLLDPERVRLALAEAAVEQRRRRARGGNARRRELLQWPDLREAEQREGGGLAQRASTEDSARSGPAPGDTPVPRVRHCFRKLFGSLDRAQAQERELEPAVAVMTRLEAEMPWSRRDQAGELFKLAQGTIASASISTSQAGSRSSVTTIALVTGLTSRKTWPCARPTSPMSSALIR